MMKLIAVLLIVVFTTFTTSDPDNLQDICVADLASAIIVNGFPCKPATTVTAADFNSKILATPGATTNTTFGSSVTDELFARVLANDHGGIEVEFFIFIHHHQSSLPTFSDLVLGGRKSSILSFQSSKSEPGQSVEVWLLYFSKVSRQSRAS
ncbi:rhicadhesin receptor [Trifolium repens]|nr:rhicadhesin receptor [Trifolium repens]